MNTTQSTDRTLTRADVIKRTGKTERTIHRWMASGRLEFTRDPQTGRLEFTESDVRRAMGLADTPSGAPSETDIPGG